MARRAEAKRLLSEHPFCIYCGGHEPATQIDHMPNKGMFPKSIRPKGLEFPACLACNQGSRWFEDIAAFIGSIRLEDAQLNLDHVTAKLAALANNNMAALHEMQPGVRENRAARRLNEEGGTDLGIYRLDGPIVSRALMLFGAKLAMALHWQASGRILSRDDRLGVLCFTNERHFDGGVPQALFEMLPNTSGLRMGKLTADEVFQYSSGQATDTEATAHWAIFGPAFMYYLFVGGSLSFSTLPTENIFQPGCILNSAPPQPTINWSLGPVQLH